MLHQVSVANYRCLRDVVVPLSPLTVLVGPNDSGKSAFLHALRYLIDGNLRVSDFWRQDQRIEVKVIAKFDSSEFTRSTLPVQNTVPITPLARVVMFQLPSKGALMESVGQGDHEGPPELQEDGGNVATVLDYLLRKDRKRFFAVVDTMRRLVPGLEDLDIATPDASKRRLDLVIEKGLRIPADLASAGVRLLLVFVTLAYHPTPPKTILLEEPENGIHPKRLEDVIKLLREITEGKHGEHAAQVIMTTHSPYLLDFINLDKDQVLVFRREANGSRTAQAADPERLRLFLDEFLLGEVWFNQGEEGLLAKHS